ncbi:MAG TPA: ABC transporter substrate-binding protein [Falsiroseomonas sp.]|jgi:peptide/nickel transport system substrate-binding protein|nr:ABC transporter substrate-binding protein [Falsiroseomonas sp.]
MRKPAAALVAALLATTSAFGQTLTIGLTTAPTALDPHYHAHAQNSATAAHVFETLFRPDAAMQLTPGLAIAARTSDAVTWEITLREGVRWHDGTPFTAEDIAFSLRRAPDVPNSPGSYGTYTREIAAVEITGPHSLRITARAPAPLLMSNLANIFIVSRRHGGGATTDDYNSGKAMVGTGPYRFQRWSAGTEIHFSRSEDHWAEREPWERVQFRVIANNPARLAALLAGDVDVIADVPSADVERLRGDPRFRVHTIASSRLVFLGIDRTDEALSSGHIRAADGAALPRSPLADVRVRRALSMALDRRAIVERINEGQAVMTGQFVPEGFFGHFPDIAPDAFDPQGARRLLSEAGWPNGFRLTLATSNDRIFNAPRMVQAIAQMWSRIGVQTTVELMPHAVFTPRRNRYEIPVFLSSWGNQTGEPLYTLVPQLGTRSREGGLGAANRIRYSNPELDRLLSAASAELDRERLLGLLRQATDLALSEAVMLPLLLQVNNWGARRGLVVAPRIDQYTLAMSIRPE